MIKKFQTKNKHIPSQHFVDFYSSKDILIENLTRYISEGLRNGETCIVIAIPEHLEMLSSKLKNNKKIIKDGLIALDAETTLASFMVGNMPDKELFYEKLGSQIEKIARSGKPIRAYGEMVALLWKEGNVEALIELENLWNELAESNSFYLYCAYPELHFIMDPAPKQAIIEQHKTFFSSPAISLV